MQDPVDPLEADAAPIRTSHTRKAVKKTLLHSPAGSSVARHVLASCQHPPRGRRLKAACIVLRA